MTAPTDAQLLARTAAGDHGAYEQLYARHVSACRHRARHVVQADELVDDVLQSVFLDVWVHAGRYDGTRGSARSWLLTLTHHKAVDLVRRHEHRNRHSAPLQEAADRVDQAALPEDVATGRDEAVRLRTHVARLPVRLREAVSLCFLEELSQREAARVLQVPVGTVKSRSSNGVRALGLLLAASA